MKISICIPTWENHGLGVYFLKRNFESIKSQTYSDFNVVISDHSKNDDIKNLCDEYSTYFEIKYFKNDKNYGNSPHNTNHSILKSDGEIVKIMFQDDFFFSNESLQLIKEKFDNIDCNWLVCGCNHTYDNGQTFIRNMIPRWNDDIIIGVNTISSPSVLSFRKNVECLFDENLVMMMDCEMYYQLYLKFGTPTIVDNILVTNRVHEYQISNQYKGDMSLEIDYIKIKYNL
jgi:glycosyltransferase involved in cell wall biosynthesis